MLEILDPTIFLIQTFIVFLICTLIVNKRIKRIIPTIILLSFKFFFFFSYFLFWSKNTPIQLSDDIVYYQESISVFNKMNGNLLNLFRDNNLTYLHVVAGGQHIGFYIFNFISFLLFGEHYYSPVLLNLLISTITCVLLFETMFFLTKQKKMSLMYLYFLLIHWDLIAWSSFINLKDTLILFLLSAFILIVLKFKDSKAKFTSVLLLSIIILSLLYLRFYLSYFLIIILLFFVIYSSLQQGSILFRYKIILNTVILFILPVSFIIAFRIFFDHKLNEIGGTPTNIVFGSFRYLLTPFPLNIEQEYSFLTIPTIVYWCFIPYSIYGFYLILKKYSDLIYPLILLFSLLTVFYGSFAELQGPRHRVTVMGILTLVQFLGFYKSLLLIKKR